jgi:hypothetical protein
MNKININHELPISLLEKYNTKFNDYDFILPSFLKHEEYKNYYINLKNKTNRFSIMDNGLFEGDNFTDEQLIDYIKELKPDIFIIPDAWDNYRLTLRNAKNWVKYFLDGKLSTLPKLMVVMQGNVYSDFRELYRECVNLGITHFAFNHSSFYYRTQDTCNEHNHLINQMMGRIGLISKLKNEGHIEDDHYIHLLGASLPQEFIYYPEEYKFIKSLDTSNPVICGLESIKYNNWGLLEKPKSKMEKYIDIPLFDPFNIDLIQENVCLFDTFVNQNTIL